LQVIDQQVRPRAVDCLHLADDAFFKIEPALAPAEDLRHGRFSFERAKHRVAHRSVVQVDLTVTAPGFEREPTAPLAQAAHLQISAAEN
jgi:hypothetical protein